MLLYVAGPYRAFVDEHGKAWTVQDNIDVAQWAAVKVWEAGHTALCPHLNTAHFESFLPDMPAQRYIDGDFRMLAMCDGIVMLPNWEHSDGARQELQFAAKYDMPVYYYPDLPPIHWTEQASPVQCLAFAGELGRMYRVHLAKNADYSPANIAGTGMVGLATRMWDKMARLMSLQGFHIKVELEEFVPPREPRNESTDDTLLDLANYGVIAKLYRQGQWGR